MEETFTMLPVFLQKLTEAIAMLPSMILEEKMTAIDFLRDVVSNFDVDRDEIGQQTQSSVAKESIFFERLQQSGCLETLSKMETEKVTASFQSAQESRNIVTDVSSEQMQGVTEVSQLPVNKNVNNTCDILENPHQEHLCLSSSAADRTEPTEDSHFMLHGIKFFLPKEYGELNVMEEDCFEDELSEQEEEDEHEDEVEDEKDDEEVKLGEISNAKSVTNGQGLSEIFTCKACHKKYSRLKDLQNHELVHNKPHVCSVCGAGYVRRKNLVEHQRKHTGEMPYKCPHCWGNLQTVRKLNHHIQKTCPVKNKVNRLTNGGRKVTDSEQQHRIAMNSYDPREKTSVPTPEESVDDSTFDSYMELSAKRSDYICDDCNSSFSDKETFYRHTLCHKPQKYDCDMCPAKFFLKSSLDAHMNVHKRKQCY